VGVSAPYVTAVDPSPAGIALLPRIPVQVVAGRLSCAPPAAPPVQKVALRATLDVLVQLHDVLAGSGTADQDSPRIFADRIAEIRATLGMPAEAGAT